MLGSQRQNRIRPGMLIESDVGHGYDYMVWGDQDLEVSDPVNAYGRIVIKGGLIGLVVRAGLTCHAVLFGDRVVIVPDNWCIPI